MTASSESSLPFDLSGIRLVTFDLDDTLWDCAPVIRQAETHLYGWMGDHLPRITEQYDPDALHQHRLDFYTSKPELRTDVTAMRLAWIEHVLQEFEYHDVDAEAVFDVFYRARSDVELYGGTHELLAALNQRYLVAAITNGNADLSHIGIAHYFHDIQRASLDNAPKPETTMFERCMQALNVTPTEVLHVGDNPHTDVGGAHNAGARSVWFNQHGEPWPDHLTAPHIEVASLAQLQALLV